MELNLIMEDYIFLTSKGISCEIRNYSSSFEMWLTSDNIEIMYFNHGNTRIEVYGRDINRKWIRLDNLFHSDFNQNPNIDSDLKVLMFNMMKESK